MGFFNMFSDLKWVGRNPCPTCGCLVTLLQEGSAGISSVAIDTGQVRTGFKCNRCKILYHGSCAPEECFCGSSNLKKVIVAHERPKCYSQNESENCFDCNLLKKFCRCAFYAKYSK